MTTATEVRAALAPALSDDATRWLSAVLESIAADPAAVRSLFPAVGRHCGRGLLPGREQAGTEQAGDVLRGWTVDDAARTLMLTRLPLSGQDLTGEVAALYRYGDSAEKRGVLRGLGPLETARELGPAAVDLVHDGLRTNDTRLIAAALDTYGARQLDAPAYRHGVLKCVFLGIPLDDVAGLTERADAELARMLSDYAREREAAGRDVPADVRRVVDTVDTHASGEV